MVAPPPGSWFDDRRLHRPQRVHAGPLFDVFRATLGNRDVAVKRHVLTVQWETAVGSAWTHSNPTNVFYHRQLGWAEREPAPDFSYFEALLRAEHAVIERAGPHWNHPGAGLARWSADDTLAPADADADAGSLALIMPWCGGVSFATLRRDDQRRWFPAMLPALWTALAACPHGDLAPADLMLEPAHGWFRILDPGVRITGPAYPGGLDFDSVLFTTNAAHYPLVLPEHGPDQPRLRAPGGGLAHVVEAQQLSMFGRSAATDLAIARVAQPAPSAADVVACGAIYFHVLAGTPLISRLGIGAPLWTGFWSDTGDRPEPNPPCLDAIAAGAIARAVSPTGATAAEIALCERLIRLDLDEATVLRCAAEVTRAIG